MGALGQVTHWIPEDDLLLKNAVEAGASLESLAKGAVQFSRRFTVRELQDRWNSLLYDPVISAEASFRIIELEHSVLSSPSNFNRFGHIKENKRVSGKRKAESIRGCYYAVRKRICNEPFNSVDLSFLITPSNSNCIGNEEDNLSGNCLVGDSMSNDFALQESNVDTVHHAFPQIQTDGGCPTSGDPTAFAFPTGLKKPVEGDFSIEHENIHKEIPCIHGENLSLTRLSSKVGELSRPEEMPLCNIREGDDIRAHPASTSDQINSHPGIVRSEFGGNHIFNSPISGCDASFHNLEYSAPFPGMPIWRTVEGTVESISALAMPIDASHGETVEGTVEGISALAMPVDDSHGLAMPVDDSHGEKSLHVGDTFRFPNGADAKNTSTSGYNVHSDSKLEIQMPCDNLKNQVASTDGYLVELSNSLLNFTNEEELLIMDADGKDMIDKSYYDGLSSLLLSSPNDASQYHIPNITEPESITTDTYLQNPSLECPGELDGKVGSCYGVGHTLSNSEVKMLSSQSSSSTQNSNEVIFCTLNTEDPDIPCNDDVFLPNRLASLSISFKAQQNIQQDRKPENHGQSNSSSQIMGSQMLQEMGLNYPVDDFGVKFELPDSDSPHVTYRSADTAYGSVETNSENVNTGALLNMKLKEESVEIAPEKHLSRKSTDCTVEKPAHPSDCFKCHHQTSVSGSKQQLDVPATIQDLQALHAEVRSLDNEEELPIDNDDDIPYFSDIEAMILDMDLDPDDQDLYSGKEVSRYQHEDIKRSIIRLEQGAYSYMQRAIASHGAVAVLYGRHSKHYIKKPEVLLGRATNDAIVDVDLRMEGPANKISRQQAIIKMDKGGSFCLKNLGKCSISVNNKEVFSGQSLSLNSCCLIEIRGMPFIFEINQTCVKQYLDSIAKNQENQEHLV